MPADLIARQGVAVRADLRAAAFGDRPDTPVFGTAADRQASPRDRWLAAVTLGGQGRYAAAAATLRDLHTGPDPLFAALAGATMASHLRQLGGHEHARRLDAAALRRLPSGRLPSGSEPDLDGVDHTGALVDALLGLAADAIGLGRVTEAARLHAAAIAAAGDERVWRVTVRIDWVATEVALAAGRFDDAVPPAERAVAAARAAGAVRHTVKSTMMLGAALTAGGTPDGRRRARGLLTEALAASLRWGMFPLGWPSASLLADLADDEPDRYTEIAANALTSVFWWSDAAMRRMGAASVWLPTALIRSGEPTRSSVELAT